MKLNENTISNLLTVLIFILVGALLFNYFRSINRVDREQTTSTSTEMTDQQKSEMTVPEVVSSGLPAQYTVKAGDSLWKISQAAYGTGYDWTQVYEANKDKISDPNVLIIGTQITLPKIQVQPIEYTVVKGDNLWNISLRLCHNGFLWSKVATDNQVSNPQIIEPGLHLTVKCQ